MAESHPHEPSDPGAHKNEVRSDGGNEARAEGHGNPPDNLTPIDPVHSGDTHPACAPRDNPPRDTAPPTGAPRETASPAGGSVRRQAPRTNTPASSAGAGSSNGRKKHADVAGGRANDLSEDLASYKVLCTDFYVNQKLQLKMELPRTRETVLDLFERVRRQFPHMAGFRRYRDELALESVQSEMPHRWLALKGTHLRSGAVNAGTLDQACDLHRLLLEVAPAYLSISPLDVECLELLFGFDLIATGNHDAIVLDALTAGSPWHALADFPNAAIADFQPAIGLQLGKVRDLEVYFEVKTRATEHKSRNPEAGEPISVYVTLRKFGPVGDINDLPIMLEHLARLGRDLVENRVVPGILVPLRDTIASAGL